MIVLDASAALEIAKGTPKGKMLGQLMLPEEKAIAPALFEIEVANAAWKYVHAGMLDTAQARCLLDDALALPDELVPTEDLIVEAYAESVALDHSVYDMAYLVLARRNAATLFTCDAKLQECCLARDVSCIADVAL